MFSLPVIFLTNMSEIFLNEDQKAFVNEMLIDLESQTQQKTRHRIVNTKSLHNPEKFCTRLEAKYKNYLYIFENYGNEPNPKKRWKLIAKYFTEI